MGLGKSFQAKEDCWAIGWRRPGVHWLGAGVTREGWNEGAGLGDRVLFVLEARVLGDH